MDKMASTEVHSGRRSALRCVLGLWLGLLLTFGNAVAAQRFGELAKLAGDISAQDPASGTTRKLRLGDVLYVGERIEASVNGEAVIRVDDAGVIAVRPRAVFFLQAFQAMPLAESRFDLRIVRGALRLITGWVGEFNQPGYRVQTPTAVVGIRGTDHEPYVMTADLASAASTREGTYNKVNRGSVQLQGTGGSLALAPGQVGFAAAPPRMTTRGLLTALLPVLLEQVPGFYLPGQFDDGLEAYAAQQLASAPLPEGKTQTTSATPTPSSQRQDPVVTGPLSPGTCDAARVASTWLQQLDTALERRDANAFLALFTPDAQIIARARTATGSYAETRLDREALARSTLASLSRLSSFQSERPQISAKALAPDSCQTLEVRSTVIERGVSAGRSYRLESLEEYTLVHDGIVWKARKAQTTQP